MMKEQSALSQAAILKPSPSTLSFEQALTGNYRIIDVRSPKEFQDGSLPGAVNLPVFDNDERSLVGTIYRQGGQGKAIETGFGLVESRLSGLLEGFATYRTENIALFCARGGMRSRSVVNLLLQHGFNVWQLEGGYKSYRQLLLHVFEHFSPKCIVLHGHTGTGKTRILQRLSNMIDLEDLAQHQSSLFGGMNRRPRTQKNFDSHLHQVICNLGPEPYFIEGESRKLGGVYLPTGLVSAMKDGCLVLVTASMEKRVARIVEDYPVNDAATAAKVLNILKSLRSKVGNATVEKLCSLLEQGDYSELVHILLSEYYDKRYDNGMKNYRYDLEISSENIDEAAGMLTEFRRDLLCAG
jgi:tRNA 2-selenouridine synthase